MTATNAKMLVRRALLLILGLFLLPSLASAQSWSNIISTGSNRAIDWTKAGLPPTITYGTGGSACNGSLTNCVETLTSTTVPPTRTQCGSTLTPSGGDDDAQINTALKACKPGTYVLLGPAPKTAPFIIGGAGSGSSSCFGGSSYNCIEMYAQNGVTLRGSGPQSTFLKASSSGTGGASIPFGGAFGSGSCTWSAGYAAGTTSITLTSCSGTLAVNNVLKLQQCDTGYSGSGCTTGAAADNGGIYVCGFNTACQRAGEGTGNQPEQNQQVLVTNISGTCSSSCTVTISPGLYAPNWTSSQSPIATFEHSSTGTTVTGEAIEDMTIYTVSNTQNYTISVDHSYASWIKGVRFVGAPSLEPLVLTENKNALVINNYFFSDVAIDNLFPDAMQHGDDSDTLVINNIMKSGDPWEGAGGEAGTVVAYNYGWDNFTAYVLHIFEHNAGDFYMLYEGNQTASIQEDDTHGTHELQTLFRNQLPGWNVPYVSSNFAATNYDYADRFSNTIGNALGGTQTSCYTSVWLQHCSGFIYSLDETSSAHNDNGLTAASTFRWANAVSLGGGSATVYTCGPGFTGFSSAPCNGTIDTGVSVSESSATVTVTSTRNPNLAVGVKLSSCSPSGYNGNYFPLTTGGSSFTLNSLNTGLSSGTCTVTIGTEVPEILQSNSSGLATSVPATSTLPCSFFLPGYTSTSCTAHPNGGTGLSFWKVCSSWTTFPTSCASYTTTPFPPAGPDVTGGPNINGYAYNLPAEIAWLNLPIDTTYQQSFSITGSTWSGGVETLTVTGFTASTHMLGPFQILGGNCATAGAGTSTGAEVYITGPVGGSSTTTVTYALASNPGTCTGTMLFPDVREFDEQVFQADV